MNFTYEAFTGDGRRVSGRLEAASESAARHRLREGGMYVSRLAAGAAGEPEAVEERSPGDRPRLWQPKLDSVSSFTRELSVLVSTGVPIADALGAIERQEKDEDWAETIAQIRASVESGRSLSEALGEHPRYFGAVYRSLVEAGEESGELDTMLGRLAALVRQQAVARRAVVGALIYPLSLLGLTMGAAVVMLVVVVPKFAEMFTALDAELPSLTRALMGVSAGIRAYWWAALLAVGAAGGVLFGWIGTPRGRLAMDSLTLNAPLARGVTRGLGEARIARMLSTLLAAHLPLLDAIELVGGSVTNTRYRALIRAAARSVSTGEGLTPAFERSGFVSPRFVEALRTGESTGRLAAVLGNLADHADHDNDSTIKGLTKSIEPIIITLMGGMVAFLALAMFVPLFDLTSAAGGGP